MLLLPLLAVLTHSSAIINFVTVEDSLQSKPYSSERTKLIQTLIQDQLAYDFDYTGFDGVRLQIEILHPSEINVDQQDLQLQIIAKIGWTDKRLTWNDTNPQSVSTAVDKIWTPHLVILNSAKEENMLKLTKDDFLLISKNGEVFCKKRFLIQSRCSISLVHFPFDEHTCKIVFLLRSPTGRKLKISDSQNLFTFSKYYHPSTSWSILNFSHFKGFENVLEENEEKYEFILSLTLVRLTHFLAYAIFIPSLLIIFLNSYAHIIPVKEFSRIFLLLFNIFISFMLLLHLEYFIPSTGTDIPMIVRFVTALLLLNTVSFVFTLIIRKIAMNEKNSLLPNLAVKVFSSGFLKRYFHESTLSQNQYQKVQDDMQKVLVLNDNNEGEGSENLELSNNRQHLRIKDSACYSCKIGVSSAKSTIAKDNEMLAKLLDNVLLVLNFSLITFVLVKIFTS